MDRGREAILFVRTAVMYEIFAPVASYFSCLLFLDRGSR